MTDQTPDPIDVSLHRAITVAVGGMLGYGPEPEIASVALETIEAAGFRVVPIVDDATRKEVERLVADQIRAAAVAAVHDSPDLSPEDRESLQRIISFHSRTAELLDAAYLGEVG